MNTGACSSAITFIDGDQGILRYRGYPIDELAQKHEFLEVAHLLLNGELPTQEEYKKFRTDVRLERSLTDDCLGLFRGFRSDAHPMSVLGSVIFGLSSRFGNDGGNPDETFYQNAIQLIAKTPTVIAYAYKHLRGEPFVQPEPTLSYCENFLHMLFHKPGHVTRPLSDAVKALDLLLILHADHEQNCSTSTVRLARSSRANLLACISSGIAALWGKRHGGANQEVIEMLQEIESQKLSAKEYLTRVKDKKTNTLLMGFGHRVYKNFDPRAKIIKGTCDQILSKLNVNDPLLNLARGLEEEALKDPYFVDRKLYPNVDFYSGIVYKALGIPTEFFTAMFAMGRMPGWLAHAKEFSEDTTNKIGRPRQIYTGSVLRHLPSNE